MKTYTYIVFTILLLTTACKTTRVPENEVPYSFTMNSRATGPQLQVEYMRGEAHNHPLMAVWIEDENGKYIQTLFVAESIGKGVFGHGDASTGKWLPGEIRRPAALPVWSHSRGVLEEDGYYIPTSKTPIADTYTGATPMKSFILDTRLDTPGPEKFYVMFEINQTWDWNEYWTNNKFPDNEAYKSSCQPSLIYKALVDLNSDANEYTLEVVGRGHYAGEDGNIYTDLETMTTALNITREVKVRVLPVTD